MTATPQILRAIEGLQRLTELVQVRREQLAAEVGLTLNQWRVLEQISAEGFMPSLFAREQACTPANVSKTLRQLQEKGLTSVRVSPADGRQRDYALTPAGERTMGRLMSRREDAITAIWQELDPEVLAHFAEASAGLIELFEAYVHSHA